MYKRIKNILLFPREICTYVDEAWWKTFIQTALLIILYALPTIITMFISSPISSSVSKTIVNDLKTGEQIEYELKDYELVKTSDNATNVIISSSITISSQMNVYYAFSDLETIVDYSSSISNGMNIVCAFTKNNLTILYVVGSNNAVVDNSQVQLASTSGQMIVYQTSYEELKLNNFNLSKIKVSDDSDVLVFVNNIINNLTKNIIKNNAVILVIILLIYNIISYLLTILFITILEKIFYHGFKISFKKTFKIVLLCSAPYVLGVLLAQTTGISIFEILGILIMIVYVMKTIFSYKLRYGGGIPINNIKGFKINEEQKNNNIFDGTSEDVDENRGEEGKDDNEL